MGRAAAGRERRPERHRELLAQLAQAGREQSNATVMFHTAVAQRLGLGATDEKILDLLEREGPLTAGELVERTGLAPSSITAAVDRLAQRDFVARERDPRDLRRVVVSLRPEHLHATAQLFKGLGRRMDRLFQRYEDRDLEVILDFLVRSSEALRAATRDLSRGERPASR